MNLSSVRKRCFILGRNIHLDFFNCRLRLAATWVWSSASPACPSWWPSSTGSNGDASRKQTCDHRSYARVVRFATIQTFSLLWGRTSLTKEASDLLKGGAKLLLKSKELIDSVISNIISEWNFVQLCERLQRYNLKECINNLPVVNHIHHLRS